MQTKKIRIFSLSLGFFLFLSLIVQKVLPVAGVCNTGVGLGFGTAWVSLIGWIFLGIVLFLTWRVFCSRIAIISISMIFAGAVLNSIDRIRYGCVPDIFPFYNLFWFNGADVLITFGTLFLILYFLFSKKMYAG